MELNEYIEMSTEMLRSFRQIELLKLSKKSAEEAPYRQFKILCFYTLVETYTMSTCEGELGRLWGGAVLDYLDKHPQIIPELPFLRDVMEDMYVKLCDIMSMLALSYDEYMTYMERVKNVRPWTELQAGQVKLIQSMKEEGHAWHTNIMLLMGRYIGNDFGQSPSNSNAAALGQLMLQNRRRLRLPRTVLDTLLQNYPACIHNWVHEAQTFCDANYKPFNAGNFTPTVSRALALLIDCEQDGFDTAEAQKAMRSILLAIGVNASAQEGIFFPPKDGIGDVMDANLMPINPAMFAPDGTAVLTAQKNKLFWAVLYTTLFWILYLRSLKSAPDASGFWVTATLVAAIIATLYTVTRAIMLNKASKRK